MCVYKFSMGLEITNGCLKNVSAYSPCRCLEHEGEGDISLSCYEDALGDNKVEQILNHFLVNNISTRLTRLDLQSTELTQIPTNLPFFSQLKIIDLCRNNIQFIPRGAFNFSSKFHYLDLSSNMLTRIEAGAFQGT